MGAYHLTENFGNSGRMINGKVTFPKFQPKIDEYVYQFIGSRRIAPFLDLNRNGCGNSAVNW